MNGEPDELWDSLFEELRLTSESIDMTKELLRLLDQRVTRLERCVESFCETATMETA